ncbi:hypothetical protein JOF56_001780 [Kibdelosporangium banguiense]|uniref:Uncharacterized protein n=1 Tax=Kibdelosporangium banguiense TaxID=1365924 RepID=A0ABS4TBC9_9PSEU|nr:hypothetical protein [Kibdelosporangium banguiense]MBP2321395.1 hypothetical protein [Kibdelosporangium banguiense]
MAWRRCGCGCATWHHCLDGDTVACSHRALGLSVETVLWVVNPAERCRTCLLAADKVATARVRSQLAASQATMVAWMDAGIRALEQGITDERQIGDMLYEGGAVWAGES